MLPMAATMFECKCLTAYAASSIALVLSPITLSPIRCEQSHY